MIETVIAIDPGQGGGFAVHQEGKPIKVFTMPENAEGIRELVSTLAKPLSNKVAVIEVVGHFRQDDPSKRFGIDKMVRNQETIKAMLVAHFVPFIEIQAKKWQGYIGGNTGKNKQQRKKRYKEVAIHLAPDAMSALKYAEKMKVSDAVCIAYAFRQIEKEAPEFIADQLDNELP